MSGKYEALSLLQLTRRPRFSIPPMMGLIPRLPRSIVPKAPRVNLNNHWDELSAWYEDMEKKRDEARAADKDGMNCDAMEHDGNNPHSFPGNRGDGRFGGDGRSGAYSPER